MLYGQDERLSLKEVFLKKPTWLWLVILVLVFCGLGFGGFGIFQLVSNNDQEIVTSSDIESQVCEQTADFGQITVYISGAVVNPGVYILETGNRIVDLLDASGGISSDADNVYINREFNLAKRLSDGEQFYIPTKDETEEQLKTQFADVVVSNENDIEKVAVKTAESPISINSSTKNELMKLSGIGEARAMKIIENRPYNNKQELVEKGVLSSSLFAEIESEIIL